jgi:hypothetical protein
MNTTDLHMLLILTIKDKQVYDLNNLFSKLEKKSFKL